jgi:LmbE family N-acetylglucosaminyl deacetylase
MSPALTERIRRRGERLLQLAADHRLRSSLRRRRRPAREPGELDLFGEATLVVVAHPDDEAISSGALLSRLPRAGVVCVTSGAPRKESYARNAGFDNWLDYADARHAETGAALALAGGDLAILRNLGAPDQEAVFHLAAVARWLVTPLQSGFRHVVTHAYEGGHPDHDSVAFAVHAACALISKRGHTPPTILEAPLYSAPDGHYRHQTFVDHDDAGPVLSWDLSPAEQDLKARMYACYRTQKTLASDFGTSRESFRLAPRYHFTAPPHPGDVGYDQFRWPITGRIWRKMAWRAIRELGLLEELT